MITEDGSVKTADISVVPALNEYRKKLKIISLIALILGAVGVIMYIIGAFFNTEDGGTPLWADICIVFAVPLALGLVGNITIVRLHKREKAANSTSECEFFADCFFCRTKTAFRPEGITEKFSYSDAVLKRETEKYGYIFVNGTGAFLVFGKEGLEESELNAIRRLLKVPVPDGEAAELKNYKPTEENNDSEINS